MNALGNRIAGLSRLRVRNSLAFAMIALLAVGCAATRPNIRVDVDESVNFASFQSYSYVPELGTDRAGYSTLVTTYFREAVDSEMQARGYRYSDSNPDLLVNFFADAREVTSIRQPRSSVWLGYGYYGYRFGMYNVWPLYADGPQTVRYKVGTANIDIVDARRRQLIWEGVAEGRLTRKVIEDPRTAIHSVVADLFARYPGRASTAFAE